MGKPWDDLSSGERLDAILLALHTIGAEGASAAHIALVVAQEHVMRYPRLSHNGKAMSTATRVTPGIIALRKRGLIGLTRRPDGRSGSADSLTRLGYARIRQGMQLAGCTKDEYRVLLDCLRQIPMPKPPPEVKRPYVSGGPKR